MLCAKSREKTRFDFFSFLHLSIFYLYRNNGKVLQTAKRVIAKSALSKENKATGEGKQFDYTSQKKAKKKVINFTLSRCFRYP